MRPILQVVFGITCAVLLLQYPAQTHAQTPTVSAFKGDTSAYASIIDEIQYITKDGVQKPVPDPASRFSVANIKAAQAEVSTYDAAIKKLEAQKSAADQTNLTLLTNYQMEINRARAQLEAAKKKEAELLAHKGQVRIVDQSGSGVPATTICNKVGANSEACSQYKVKVGDFSQVAPAPTPTPTLTPVAAPPPLPTTPIRNGPLDAFKPVVEVKNTPLSFSNTTEAQLKALKEAGIVPVDAPAKPGEMIPVQVGTAQVLEEIKKTQTQDPSVPSGTGAPAALGTFGAPVTDAKTPPDATAWEKASGYAKDVAYGVWCNTFGAVVGACSSANATEMPARPSQQVSLLVPNAKAGEGFDAALDITNVEVIGPKGPTGFTYGELAAQSGSSQDVTPEDLARWNIKVDEPIAIWYKDSEGKWDSYSSSLSQKIEDLRDATDFNAVGESEVRAYTPRDDSSAADVPSPVVTLNPKENIPPTGETARPEQVVPDSPFAYFAPTLEPPPCQRNAAMSTAVLALSPCLNEENQWEWDFEAPKSIPLLSAPKLSGLTALGGDSKDPVPSKSESGDTAGAGEGGATLLPGIVVPVGPDGAGETGATDKSGDKAPGKTSPDPSPGRARANPFFGESLYPAISPFALGLGLLGNSWGADSGGGSGGGGGRFFGGGAMPSPGPTPRYVPLAGAQPPVRPETNGAAPLTGTQLDQRLSDIFARFGIRTAVPPVAEVPLTDTKADLPAAEMVGKIAKIPFPDDALPVPPAASARGPVGLSEQLDALSRSEEVPPVARTPDGTTNVPALPTGGAITPIPGIVIDVAPRDNPADGTGAGGEGVAPDAKDAPPAPIVSGLDDVAPKADDKTLGEKIADGAKSVVQEGAKIIGCVFAAFNLGTCSYFEDGALAADAKTPLTAGANGKIDPAEFAARTEEKIKNSPLNGFAPAELRKFGIVTGSPREWSRLFTMMQQQESGHHVARVNPDGTLQRFSSTLSWEKSFGPGQFNLGEYGLKTWADVNNPDKVIDAYIEVARQGKLLQYFGSLQRPGETLQWNDWYEKTVRPSLPADSVAGDPPPIAYAGPSPDPRGYNPYSSDGAGTNGRDPNGTNGRDPNGTNGGMQQSPPPPPALPPASASAQNPTRASIPPISFTQQMQPIVSCTPAAILAATTTPVKVSWTCFQGTARSSDFDTNDRAQGSTQVALTAASTTETRTLSAQCVGSNFTSLPAACTVRTIKPVVTLTASPAQVGYDGASTVRWAGSDVDRCNVYAPGPMLLAQGGANGTAQTPKLQRSIIVRVLCHTAAGIIVRHALTVQVAGDTQAPLDTPPPADPFSIVIPSSTSPLYTPRRTTTPTPTGNPPVSVEIPCDPEAPTQVFIACLQNAK